MSSRFREGPNLTAGPATSPGPTAIETARYVAWIEPDGTFWEVIDTRGQHWVNPCWILIGEESMLSSAIFLDALEICTSSRHTSPSGPSRSAGSPPPDTQRRSLRLARAISSSSR